jgi:hypothetical protein
MTEMFDDPECPLLVVDCSKRAGVHMLISALASRPVFAVQWKASDASNLIDR